MTSKYSGIKEIAQPFPEAMLVYRRILVLKHEKGPPKCLDNLHICD